MDNKEFLHLSNKFLQLMEKCVIDFFKNHLLEEEYNTDDLINLLLTVHMNSLFCSTESLSKDLDNGGVKVKAFNKKLSEFIHTELARLDAEVSNAH